MRLRIDIDSTALDLFKGTDKSFYITKQLNDLHNLQNRQADFTRQISVPLSANNMVLLGLDTNERLGNSSKVCNVYLDNVLILPSARLIISAVYETTAEMVILSGNFDLFDNIPNDSIKKLDFSTYNFPWTVTDLAAINATTEGPIWGSVQWYDYDSFDDGIRVPSVIEASQEISNYGFCMHGKTILKAIIEQSGYTLDDTLMTNDHYDDFVIPCPVQLPPNIASAFTFASWGLTAAFVYDDLQLSLIHI